MSDRIDWDDLRYFLCLSRAESVRAAGELLSVSHSTVARRIDAFENSLNVRLFDRLPTGFSLTKAGDDLLLSATQIEEELHTATRRLTGQDARMVGEVQVTMPDILASELLMPDLARFSHLFPDIELEIIASYELLSLSHREADIALRLIPTGKQPPEHLVGRKLCSTSHCAYVTPDYLKQHDIDDPEAETAHWIGWDDRVRHPDWTRNSALPHLPVHGRLNNALLQLAAVRQGMGVAMLPCFIADSKPDLIRVPGSQITTNFDLWILTHQDLRTTARMREFRRFIGTAIDVHKDLLMGLQPLDRRAA